MSLEEKVKLQKAWIEANPLRKYRKKAGVSMREVALVLGMGNGSIKSWETGAHMPSENNMALIAEAMEMSEPELQKLWFKWWDANPSGNRAGRRNWAGGRPVKEDKKSSR